MGHALYDTSLPVSEAKLLICGGGHVAQKTLSLAKLCDLHVTLIEDRKEYADKAAQLGADRVICGEFTEVLSAFETDEDTFILILTRGHVHDIACLRIAVKKPLAYLGMIGSKKKIAIVKETLLSEGVSEEDWNTVHSPIGLEIHAETPEEIAVAILAEIIEVKNTCGRNYGSSSEVSDALRHIQTNSDKGRKAVLASVIAKRGSAPRGAGAKMIVYEDGETVGTVGGGKGEAMVIERALEFIPGVITIEMTSEAATKEELLCGGEIDVLLEIL